MDSKRYRDAADDEPASAGKRARLDDVASAALADSSAMQAVAHEALAMSSGPGFTAINKDRPSADASTSQQHPPLQPQYVQHPQQQQSQQSQPSQQQQQQPRQQHQNHQHQPSASTPDHRRNSSSNANAGSRFSDSANRVVVTSSPEHYSRNGISSTITPADSSNGSLDTISDITRRFKSAVVNGWSRRSPTYNTIDVMLVYWEDDEAEVKTSVSNLQAAFYGSFNYPTELCTIRSSESSHNDIRARIERFFSRDQSLDRLAILYYAGQCVSSNSPDSQSLFLVPRNRRVVSSFPFTPVQTAYESTGCDVVLLMDYSEVVPFLTLGQRSNRRNVVELIVAPTPDPELGLMSFTKALTDELSHTSHDDPLKIESLHSTIFSRMSVSKPRGRGRPPKEPPARPPVGQQFLPRHQIFFHRRSIVLSPLPKEPQVIICLRVLGGSIDVSEWGKWIFNASNKARNFVQIEGMYTGFSTMIVLRVPVAQWHNFPPCPAGSFVGYTTVGDIPPRLQDRIDDELSTKLWSEDAPPTPPLMPAIMSLSSTPSSVQQHKNYSETPAQSGSSIETESGLHDSELTDANGQRNKRKALPTERKILPSGAPPSPFITRRSDFPSSQIEQPQFRPTQQHLQQYRDTVQQQSRQAAEKDLPDKNAQLEAAAQKPFKISIKHAGQSHMCKECTAGFKDADTLHNHVRKQHTRPFHCVFNWAGCESTFASKNEWKRHVMSQHILLHYWVCQVDPCCKIANKAPGVAHSKFSLPNGAIFNRKDLYTQHLRRMHTPLHVKKLMKQVKAAVKPPSHPAITDWESRLKELQEGGIRPRCRLPDFMLCPVPSCDGDFRGNNAWDERMEHVARHLEGAAAGREPAVVFGGKSDPTLTDWATRYEVGIAKRVGPSTWHLDNPLRPEIMEWTGDQYTVPPTDIASGRDMNVDKAQSHGHYKALAEAESYHQPHQHQPQHRYQHQHKFQVSQPQHLQQEMPSQYEQSQQTQRQYPPQYTDRQPQYREDRRGQAEGERDVQADVQPETTDVQKQPADKSGNREQSLPVIEVAEQKHAESPSLPSEVASNSKAPPETPAEVPIEEHVDSSVESATDVTTPKSVVVYENVDRDKIAETIEKSAAKTSRVYNDDDEKPNEDEITVATGSPRRD